MGCAPPNRQEFAYINKDPLHHPGGGSGNLRKTNPIGPNILGRNIRYATAEEREGKRFVRIGFDQVWGSNAQYLRDRDAARINEVSLFHESVLTQMSRLRERGGFGYDFNEVTVTSYIWDSNTTAFETKMDIDGFFAARCEYMVSQHCVNERTNMRSKWTITVDNLEALSDFWLKFRAEAKAKFDEEKKKEKCPRC